MQQLTLFFKLRAFVGLVLLLLSQQLYAQVKFTLEISAFVKKDGKKLEGATVTLVNGGTDQETVTTTSSGKFSFKTGLLK